MSDDLVARLREGKTKGSHLQWVVTDTHKEAADRIESLEDQLAQRDAALKAADDLAGRFQVALNELQSCTVEIMGEDYNCPDHNAARAAYRKARGRDA